MRDATGKQSSILTAISIFELIFHNTVRSVRKSHRNAIFAILTNVFQTVLLVVIFYFMFDILGLRGLAIRGDFLLYIMTGIFLFMTHVKSVGAVSGSEGPASPMMQHLPMNTAIAIASAALGSLYIQVLSMIMVLYFYHIVWGPITIHNPAGAMGMVFLAWYSGVAVGMVFLAAKPWIPGGVGIISQIYTRANMFASGKMFVANQLPPSMIIMFAWNPLFHIIDQARGFTFINYNPHNSSLLYPIIVSTILITVGLMGEFYTRRHASISWGAGR